MRIFPPLGIESFMELRTGNYYYVDKTELIESLLANVCKVTLITRPRRFGKTLSMSMLEDFFDISKDSRTHFDGLKVSGNIELCANWMNQWPTIFLTLKEVEGETFEDAYGMLKVVIAELCKKYSFLGESTLADPDDTELFKELKAQKAAPENVKNALKLLTRMMQAHYGKQVIVLIDEYDVPLARANENGYYRQMLDVIRALTGNSLKTNVSLKFAVVTGCLRISKESIFTGANNFVTDSITGDRFNEYIGFTQDDVEQLLNTAGLEEHVEEMKEWYDGYRFGAVDVYCPWDVLNHVENLQRNQKHKPINYWENTSHNMIIRQFIEREDLWKESQINKDLETLLAGGTIWKTIVENLTYDMIHSSADNIWSLLLLTGYLTIAPDELPDTPTEGAPLRIPNREVKEIFKTSIKEWFEDKVKSRERSELFSSLWTMDDVKCSEQLSQMVFDTISYFDYKEDFYHAYVTGILSFAGYTIKTNNEQGECRPDIILLDERNARAIVIEIKVTDELASMDAKCDEALSQIRRKRYAEPLAKEYLDIFCYGICFYKKRCAVKSEKFK